MPEKVQAHKRVVVYDYACKMHTVCLRRYPYRIRRFQFLIDRHHQSNHKACSQAYNISKYPVMDHVNTQIAEQLNNSLRKLSTVVAYSNFLSYLKLIQIFITVKNLRIKKIIWYMFFVNMYCTIMTPTITKFDPASKGYRAFLKKYTL